MQLTEEDYLHLIFDPETSSLSQIADLKRVVENAKVLFGNDINKVFTWISKPNHLFFDISPYEMVLDNRGRTVYSWQEEVLG